MSQDLDLNGVQALLRRTIGDASDRFVLGRADSPDGLDCVEIEARTGKVSLRGSSPIALCRGAYHYLRECCLQQVSWSGDAVRVPAPLPDCPLTRLQSRVKSRHFGSVCVYGYSACWWDWPRWERELDWMALRGIDQPLLLAGQEAVTRRVLLSLGLKEQEVTAHFSGPAYLCWHRLGNLNGYMGPSPRHWIDSQEQLQARVLERARELGMRPIVPGFSGFVPEAISRVFPGVELMSAEPWAGFEKTTYLDPRSEAFQQIGRLFLDEYRRAYGPAHHYLCELFAEQVPCIDPQTELEDLRDIGRATWRTLESFDPDATWVMQGWPFYFARDYWQPEKATALLEAAPPGRTMVLDLATDELETWRLQPAMREKGWMFNVVHNYGQNTHLHGDLAGFVDRAESALRHPSKGRLQGMGISPEGIDQNPVVYELLADLPWGTVDLDDWLPRYARSRYGRRNDRAEHCWSLLSRSVYGPELPAHPRYTWRYRPGDQPLIASPDPSTLTQALEHLLSASDQLSGSSNYRRDVVDLAKTWLGGITDRLLEQALETQDPVLYLECLDGLDRLLATRPEHRLSTWLESCLRCAPEQGLLEHNARSLISYWGGPFLFDYATREWAGLTVDFHAERWRLWFEHLAGASPEPDFAAWEREWAASTRQPKESLPGPEVETAAGLFAKYRDLRLKSDRSLHVHRLEPQPLKDGALVVELAWPATLTAAACVPLFGQGFKGRYALELCPAGRWTSVDAYFGARETCRGMRFRFEPTAVDSLRFRIDLVQGSIDQQFQVVLFEPA